MKVKEIKDKALWDELAEYFGAGPYLYWAWREAVEAAYGHQALYLAAFEGEEPLGLLPLFKFKSLRGKYWVSLPFCDYGGIIARHEKAFILLLEAARKISGSQKLELRFPERPPFLSPEEGSQAKVRLILDLPEDETILWKQLKSKVRSQVRRPQKEGAKAISGGVELLPAFYRIYQQNMHFLGSPPHHLRWFKAVVSFYGERAKVVLVHLRGEPLAGGILLFTPEGATNPWASSRREYKRLSPNMLLYWQMLALSASKGLSYFDFGRSSPGSGTYRFKKQWGASEKPLFWYGVKDEHVSRGREIFVRLWQKLPASLVNSLGPRLRGYISL